MESITESAGAPVKQPAFWGPIPALVFFLAALAAVFHLSVVWYAQADTPPGWEFTGNLSNSPDYMQYRVWMDQARTSGPIVENRLTPEANSPHLPVFFYWSLGRMSSLTGIQSEFLYEYAGGLLAALFVVLLFLTVRMFLTQKRATWWVFLIVLLGGGLTSLLKHIAATGGTGFGLLNRILNSVYSYLTFDALRFGYVYKTLLDTHFLVVYVSTTLTLVVFYFAAVNKSARYYVATALLAIATTMLHLYEGLLLASIALVVSGLLWAGGRATGREALRLFAACGGAAALTLGVLLQLQRASGLSITTWQAPDIVFANVLLAHPVGWAVLALGLPAIWPRVDERHLFLMGWIGGCLILLLSSPYFPFADRGATTLQIPLYILAGLVYFSLFRRVPVWGAVLVILLLGWSLPLTASRKFAVAGFTDRAPAVYLDEEHRRTLAVLRSAASERDVLLAEYFDYRWIVPSFRGRGYHPHFFLTTDFESRRARAEQFFEELGPARRAEFLAEEGISFVWVDHADYDSEDIAGTPGLAVIDRGSHGTLFRFDPAAAVADEKLVTPSETENSP